jgi:hypothetical protein
MIKERGNLTGFIIACLVKIHKTKPLKAAATKGEAKGLKGVLCRSSVKTTQNRVP